jgi:glycosyltransferase involved in cell wall biosynthesis
MREGITAIIPSFRRHENIPIIINRLKNQTCKPDRIIVWNDNSGEFGRNLVLDDKDVEVINTNSNFYTFGVYMIGYSADTKYVAIVDDDMAPGPKWFELCLRMQQTTPGIYGGYGVIFLSNRLYLPNRHMYTKCLEKERLVEVDMVGTSYFFPYNAINCFLSKRPPSFPSITDMHLCYTSQKYGNLKTYVIYPTEEEARPSYNDSELIFNNKDHSRSAWRNDNYHYINRCKYLRWATQQGWKLIMDRGGFVEEEIP